MKQLENQSFKKNKDRADQSTILIDKSYFSQAI